MRIIRRRRNLKDARMRSSTGDVPSDSSGAWRPVEEALASDDLKVTRIRGRGGEAEIAAVYLESLVDRKRLVREVFEPLETDDLGQSPQDPRERFGHAERLADPDAIVTKLLQGCVALYGAGSRDAYLIEVPAQNARKVSEPTTEVQLIGPKEAFTEELQVNLSLLRARLATPKLRVRMYQVGRLSQTKVAVVHLDGITNPEIVRRIHDALPTIDVDFIRSTDDLHELLFGRSLSPFPLTQRTERVDRVALAIADGRVAIFVDGTPFPLLLPTTLNELQRDGEYFLPGPIATVFVRWLRYLGIALSVAAPGLYTGILSVDLPILPPEVLLVVASTREGIPYPLIVETLLMLVIMDVVTEAGLQSPTQIGQTLTIVGSLIIGQVAVQSRLASQLMVIVLAITAIGSLLAVNVPLGYAARFSKYPLTILAGILGVYGLVLGMVALTVHLASLKSAGVPYLTPFAPVKWTDLANYSLFSRTKGERDRRPQSFRAVDERRSAPRGRSDSDE